MKVKHSPDLDTPYLIALNIEEAAVIEYLLEVAVHMLTRQPAQTGLGRYTLDCVREMHQKLAEVMPHEDLSSR